MDMPTDHTSLNPQTDPAIPADQPRYIGVGGIFIDDIVFPDGRTQMGVLGGGVVHGATGMRLWNQRAGIVACAGHDLPDAARERLIRDFDLQGVQWRDIPQVRSWQIFEWDGRRRELFRVEIVDPFVYEPGPEAVPDAYLDAQGVYLLRDAAISGWRERFPEAVLLWEPLQQEMIPTNAAAIRAALPLVDIVSPNWLEAKAIYGRHEPADLVQALLDDGARIAALRMGEEGSLVGQQGDPIRLRVPAVPVPEVIDQTGAGNTYCGAFLAGWCETGQLDTAAGWGAVAASFALEVNGVAIPGSDHHESREARLAWLRGRITRAG